MYAGLVTVILWLSLFIDQRNIKKIAEGVEARDRLNVLLMQGGLYMMCDCLEPA